MLEPRQPARHDRMFQEFMDRFVTCSWEPQSLEQLLEQIASRSAMQQMLIR